MLIYFPACITGCELVMSLMCYYRYPSCWEPPSLLSTWHKPPAAYITSSWDLLTPCDTGCQTVFRPSENQGSQLGKFKTLLCNTIMGLLQRAYIFSTDQLLFYGTCSKLSRHQSVNRKTLWLICTSVWKTDFNNNLYSINTLRPRKTADISQTTYSNVFSSTTMFEFRFKLQWSLFLRV